MGGMSKATCMCEKETFICGKAPTYTEAAEPYAFVKKRGAYARTRPICGKGPVQKQLSHTHLSIRDV